MSDDSDNVIDLADARKRIEARTTLSVMHSHERTGKFCRHRDILVGHDFGDVECSACGVKLNAHDVLLQYALEERHFLLEDKRIRAEHERIRKELVELKAEEKRVKARVKRAKEKGA